MVNSYITRLDHLIQNVFKESLDVLTDRLDLTLNTALNDLCTNTWLCVNKRINYNISYVNNTLIKSNLLTAHGVEIGGTAISADAKIEVYIDSLKLESEFIIANNDNIRIINIPKENLKVGVNMVVVGFTSGETVSYSLAD